MYCFLTPLHGGMRGARRSFFRTARCPSTAAPATCFLGFVGCSVASVAVSGGGPASAHSGNLPYSSDPEFMGFARPPPAQDDITTRQCLVRANTFGRRAGQVTCSNSTATRQRVQIPQGYMFQPDDPDMQTLITERDLVFFVEPGGTATQEFDAFCGFSKGRVPRGNVSPTGYVAPPTVLANQSTVWAWTRPFERKPQNGGSQRGGWGAIASLLSRVSPSSAAEQKRILKQSYGMSDKELKAMAARHQAIDKNPAAHQFNGRTGAGVKRGAPTSRSPASGSQGARQTVGSSAKPPPPSPSPPCSGKPPPPSPSWTNSASGSSARKR